MSEVVDGEADLRDSHEAERDRAPSAQPLPAQCPACRSQLHVERLACDACGTEVDGLFVPCRVCSLDEEARELLELFLDCRGNMKDVMRDLGVSYPTVRQRMEDVWQKLEAGPPRVSAKAVLRRLSEGDISVDEAERLLRGT